MLIICGDAYFKLGMCFMIEPVINKRLRVRNVKNIYNSVLIIGKYFLLANSKSVGPCILKCFGTNFFLTGLTIISKNLRFELSKRFVHVLFLIICPIVLCFKIFKYIGGIIFNVNLTGWLILIRLRL